MFFLKEFKFRWPSIVSDYSDRNVWVPCLSSVIYNCIIWYFATYLFKDRFFNNKRVREGSLHIPKDFVLFQYNLKNSSSTIYHLSCLSVVWWGLMLKWEIRSKLHFSRFSFKKILTCFAFASTFSWLTLDIATLFPSALADSVSWTISLAISQIVYSDTKSYWTGDFLFFLGRFHVLLRIVHFSTWETLYNNMRLKLSSLRNGVSVYIFYDWVS